MTTELEVLNHMLNVNGENPISSADSLHPSAIAARVELDRITREFQRKEWWFNTDRSLKLLPNDQGEVVVPMNTLKFKSLSNKRYVTRGNRIYDRVGHTYNFGQSIYADITILLSVEELPESAAAYLKHKCAYDFYLGEDGDETKLTRLKKEVDDAWTILKDEHLEQEEVNAFERPIVQEMNSRLNGGYAPNGRVGRINNS